MLDWIERRERKFENDTHLITQNMTLNHKWVFRVCCCLFRLFHGVCCSRVLYWNEYLKIIQLPRCSLPTVRKFVDVLVKADIPGIRPSVGRVYTVTESFIRDISRLQTEREDTTLCKKRKAVTASLAQDKENVLFYVISKTIMKNWRSWKTEGFFIPYFLHLNRDVLLLD